MNKSVLIKVGGGILAVLAVYFGYRYFTKTKAVSSANTTMTTDKTATATLPSGSPPPPMYSGPMGGPYQWGGVGEPPDGVYTINVI